MTTDPFLALLRPRRAAVVGSRRQVGRTQDVVRCTCGHVNAFYRWSWAGHGKARCRECKRWIIYAGLEVRGEGE